MPPVNMKAPVNSPYDDFSMFFEKDIGGDDKVLARGFLTSIDPEEMAVMIFTDLQK